MSFYYKIPNIGTYASVRKIYVEPTFYPPRKYTNVSRYAETLRLFDEQFGVYYHETSNADDIPISSNDKYITVDRVHENRLDVIANETYGYSAYWWIIAKANNIVDPFDVPYGTVLRLPPTISIYANKTNIIL